MTERQRHAEEPLLRVRGLSAEFALEGRVVRAVHDVSFELQAGEILGLVGESGCGKSATCLSLMGLLPEPYGRVVAGQVRLDGQELTELRGDALRRFRGQRIGVVFQDPMNSLNPYMTVEEQLIEGPMLHLGQSRARARERALELLEAVGIPEARRRLSAHPHELSGGMRQRVMIAMALACEPKLIIADEPTTALDVTTQAQILALLRRLQLDYGVAVILVTHDLAVVAETCDTVAVMYAGRVVEYGPVSDVLSASAHPYTAALLASVPRIESRREGTLQAIDGLPPRLDRGPFSACAFAPRCTHATAECGEREPLLASLDGRRLCRCVHPLAGGVSTRVEGGTQ